MTTPKLLTSTLIQLKSHMDSCSTSSGPTTMRHRPVQNRYDNKNVFSETCKSHTIFKKKLMSATQFLVFLLHLLPRWRAKSKSNRDFESRRSKEEADVPHENCASNTILWSWGVSKIIYCMLTGTLIGIFVICGILRVLIMHLASDILSVFFL